MICCREFHAALNLLLLVSLVGTSIVVSAGDTAAGQGPLPAAPQQAAATAAGQEQAVDTGELTLDRIYSSDEFDAERFGPARWLDGTSYTTVEASEAMDGASEIVRYDAATGEREVMVAAGELVPEGAEEALEVDDYAWSQDRGLLLLFTNTRRVWRQNTRGDYWVLDRATGRLHQLGGDAPEATLMFAKLSPDATRVAYVQGNDLWVEELASGEITRLTDDGSPTMINGTFDWVYEEEFGLRDGFRWSPEGTHIAYWKLDASGIGTFYLINNTDSLYPELTPLPYPKAGTTNPAARVGVIPASGGDTVWMDVPGDPRDNYIARMEWAASSDELVLQHFNRRQNHLEVLLADAATGAARTVHTEDDEAWIDVVDDLQWMNDGKAFTWVSERDGWRRAYVIARDGGWTRAVTPAGVDVMSIAEIDTEDGWLYYIAAPGEPARRYLFRARLQGDAEEEARPAAERLTPVDAPGTHGYQIAPGAGFAIHTYSSFSTPPVIALVSLPEHARLRTLVDNAELAARVDALEIPPVEFFEVSVPAPRGEHVDPADEDAPTAGTEPNSDVRAATGEAVLDGWMMKPRDFDPSRSYPVLFYVYGEPAGQTVRDAWGGAGMLWHQLIAERGYLVVSIDNRGTPAPKGRAWRKIINGEIGTIASQDQANAVRRLAAERPYIDLDRIGVWGWSGGGSMTLNLLFRYPELYDTGMSVAPVPDQRLYDTIYQERYMGRPQDNPEGYRAGSPITWAERLEGDLLVVHGTGDDNVHYQGTERLIDELIRHGKHFTMMAYPNRSHGIFEGEGTTRHLRGLLTRYLEENLPAGPR